MNTLRLTLKEYENGNNENKKKNLKRKYCELMGNEIQWKNTRRENNFFYFHRAKFSYFVLFLIPDKRKDEKEEEDVEKNKFLKRNYQITRFSLIFCVHYFFKFLKYCCCWWWCTKNLCQFFLLFRPGWKEFPYWKIFSSHTIFLKWVFVFFFSFYHELGWAELSWSDQSFTQTHLFHWLDV